MSKAQLQDIKEKLEMIRDKFYKTRYHKQWIGGHRIDYDYSTWNDPIDGLDYAIMLIETQLNQTGGK